MTEPEDYARIAAQARDSQWRKLADDEGLPQPKPSPFYDSEENSLLHSIADDTPPGVVRHSAMEPVDPCDFTQGFKLVQRTTSEDKPIVKTAADDAEEIYQRLDRGLGLVEKRDTYQQGLDDLYALRDEIYRKLR